MAQKPVYLSVELNDEASAKIKAFEQNYVNAMNRVKKSADDASSATRGSFTKIGNAIENLKGKYLAVSAGLTGIIMAGSRLVSMMMEQEKAENKLAKAMANTGQYSRDSFESLVKYSETIQQLTIYSDEVVLAEMAILQTFGLSEQQMKRATTAAMDLASARDMELRSAIMLVGKAYAGNVAMLHKYGITITETNDKTKQFEMVLGELERRFGGSAQAELQTYAGKWRQYMNAIGEAGEMMGKGIVLAFEGMLWSTDKLEQVGLQEGVTAGQYKNRKALDATSESLAKQTALMEEHVKMYEKELEAEAKAYQKQLKYDDERSRLIEEYIGILQEGQANIDQMLANLDVYTNEELKMLIEKAEADKKAAEDMVAQNRQSLDQMARDSDETFSAMSDFYRDALSQMVDDTGSFVEMIKKKLMNLGATVVSNVLANVTQALLGRINVLGPGGPAGFNLGRLLTGSSTGGRLFGLAGGSAFPVNAAGQYMGQFGGQSVAVDAVSGATPYVSPINWMGAGTGALGLIGGGYGVYDAYRNARTPGQGLLQGGLGGGIAAYGGMAAAAALGAQLGSVVPVVGTIIGAIVGGVIGAIGGKSNEAQARRMKRAERYGTQLSRAVESDAQTWEEWFESSENLLSKKGAYAFQKYGGVSAPGLGENLFRMADIGREYKKAVETYGDASPMAIGALHKLGNQMELFSAQSKGWGKDARAVAEQWALIVEKTKKIQINEILDDLSKGAGSFVNTLSKLELIDMDESERSMITYQKTMEFLTSATIPALAGELTRAREMFKEAKAEVDRLAKAEADAAIKAQILASDIELTEAQLNALRLGEINTDLIALYTALGETDTAFDLLIIDARETQTVWQQVAESTKRLRGSLESLAEQFQSVFAGSDRLAKAYADLMKLVTAVEHLAEAGQRIKETYEAVDDAVEALKTGDLSEFNNQVLKITDNLLYMSAVMEEIGQERVAQLLLNFGQIGTVVYIGVEAVMMLGRAIRWVAEENGQFAASLERILNLIGKVFPKLAEWLKGQLLPEVENIKITIDELSGAMSVSEAAGMVKTYRDKGKPEERLLKDRARDAERALWQQYEEAKKRAEEGGVTESEKAALQRLQHEIREAVADLWRGVEDELDAMHEAAQEAEEQAKSLRAATIKGFTARFEDIINTTGMSDYGKQMYAINKEYKDNLESLDSLQKELSLTGKEYDRMKALMQQARNIQIEELKEAQQKARDAFAKPFQEIIATANMGELEKSLRSLAVSYDEQREAAAELGVSIRILNKAYNIQAREIIKGFWDPVIKNIKDSISGLTLSKYNLAAPIKRAELAQDRYAELKARLASSSGEEFARAFQEFGSFYGTYLEEMQQTYRSSSAYTEAYNDVMETLNRAQLQAQENEAEMLSAFERGVYDRVDDLQVVIKQLKDQEVVSLEQYKALTREIDARQQAEFFEQQLAINSLESLAVKRNEKLDEIRGVLLSMDGKLSGSSRSGGNTGGSSTQSGRTGNSGVAGTTNPGPRLARPDKSLDYSRSVYNPNAL